MKLFDLLARTRELHPANLTIREQARLFENPNNTRWRAIFPKKAAASYKLSELTRVDFRPVAGRRAFNAPGREMAEKFGPAREFRMLPINPTKHFDEELLQELRERSQQVEELVQRGIVKDVDAWATALADSVDRQLEVDAFTAWYFGRLALHDPEHKLTVEVDLKYDPARYPVELTPWTDAGVNAFDRLTHHLGEATNMMGSVAVARLRRRVLQEIVRDAPTGPNGIRPTVANVEDRLRDEGFDVKLVVDERTYDKQIDGTASAASTVATKYVPMGRIAFQPESGVVGNTHFAPVTRAYDFMQGGERQATLEDVTVFHSTKNEGKTLLVEAEALAAPLPDERNLYVVDTGIAGA